MELSRRTPNGRQVAAVPWRVYLLGKTCFRGEIVREVPQQMRVADFVLDDVKKWMLDSGASYHLIGESFARSPATRVRPSQHPRVVDTAGGEMILDKEVLSLGGGLCVCHAVRVQRVVDRAAVYAARL